jgi:uncharacterized protein YciI
VRPLEPHTIVLLRLPARPPELPEEESDRIQEAHLSFLDEQRAAGALLAAGPFRDRVDENLRGLCVYALQLSEVRKIAAQDPSVIAGCMEAQVFTWLIPPGQARFGPGA